MQSQQLRYALELTHAQRGIIPLTPRGKRPLIDWEKYQSERATKEQVNEWGRLYPNCNFGVVTGSISSLVVVDVDGPDSPFKPEPTFTVKTGRGFHYYYSTTEKIGNKVGFMPHTDLRGEGGFVVSPYSVHENGSIYLPLNNLPVRPLPSEYLPLFEGKKDVVVKTEGWVSELIDGLAEGNRNDSFCRIVGKLHSQRYTQADIYTLLAPHAKECGYDEEELKKQIEYITKRYEIKGTEPKTSLNYHSCADSWEVYREARRNKGSSCNLPTGFTEVDKLTDGFKRQELSIIGARTSIGKTTFLINASLSLAKCGKSVLYFSTEMDFTDIFDRLVCVSQGTTLRNIKTGAVELKPMPLSIKVCDTSQPSLEDIRKAVDEVKPDVVILDHLQHVITSDARYFELSKFVRGLKDIARQFNVAVVCSSQLNRAADTPDYRSGMVQPPSLRHFKECSTIEDECSVGILLYYSQVVDNDTVILAAKIDKNRHGACGIVNLKFNKPTFTISNL